MVSNHAARSELFRVAPSRRDLAIPSSISAIVTAYKNNEADWIFIHSTSAGGAGRDGAAAEMTVLSTRYTGIRDQLFAILNCCGSVDRPPSMALPSTDGGKSEHWIAAPTPHSSRPQPVACRGG